MADLQLQQVELKRRLREAESQNEEMILKIQRTKKLIQRARLERTILLERLEQSTGSGDPTTVESPPQSPIETVAPPVGERRKEPDRKRTAPRDPRLPKRAQNAYILFCDAEKDNVKKKMEETQEVQDITKAMADAWKNLGPEGRKKYTDRYKEDRLRYLREMAAVNTTGLSATDQKEKQRAIKQLREAESQQDNESNDEQTEDEKPKIEPEPESEAQEPPSEAHEPEQEHEQEQEQEPQSEAPEPESEAPEAPNEAPSATPGQ